MERIGQIFALATLPHQGTVLLLTLPTKKEDLIVPKTRLDSLEKSGIIRTYRESNIFSHVQPKAYSRYSSVSAGSCITYRFGANGNRGLVSFVHSKQNIFGKTCCIVQTNYSSGV